MSLVRGLQCICECMLRKWEGPKSVNWRGREHLERVSFFWGYSAYLGGLIWGSYRVLDFSFF